MTMDPRLTANALMPRQSDQLMDNWYQQNKLMEQTPPWQQNQGILSNPAPRPQDWHNRSGVTDYVANAINPAMIGYGAGQMAGEARNALLDGDYAQAGGLGILSAMAAMPGRLRSSKFDLNYFGQPVRIMQNPSPQRLHGAIAQTKYKAMRRIEDADGNVYVWDAADPALHHMVAKELGLDTKTLKLSDTIGID